MTRTLAPILAESTIRTTRRRFCGVTPHDAHERAESWLARQPAPFGSCRQIRATPRGYCVTVHVLRWAEPDSPPRYVQPVVYMEPHYCPPPGWDARLPVKGESR